MQINLVWPTGFVDWSDTGATLQKQIKTVVWDKCISRNKFYTFIGLECSAEQYNKPYSIQPEKNGLFVLEWPHMHFCHYHHHDCKKLKNLFWTCTRGHSKIIAMLANSKKCMLNSTLIRIKIKKTATYNAHCHHAMACDKAMNKYYGNNWKQNCLFVPDMP